MGGKPGLPEENFLAETAGELSLDMSSFDVCFQTLGGGRLVFTDRAGMANLEVDGFNVLL